ncbi:thymidylate synthase [Curtobacterium flaccumfaciens]|uniref:thymidylate synthase n=1 Tax=Curtobacterium flaccumfaciens TaxID=2035 RepID=UPI001ADC122D|nr:thymidylate synthase [Curtobacterium flaccumfaciens]MBO9049523.1 hypothetical protein [Curtobacterium flaccumfaciens pv. flaccumfaciens]
MQYRNAELALLGLGELVLRNGNDVVSRGSATRELRHVAVTLQHPLERMIATPGRHNNPFAAIAETIWVLAGRNDVEFLRHYVPRAADFSDDGRTWRAGYGPRLRNWHGIDQVARVVAILNGEPSSRRAVMSLFDPAEDYQLSRDVPCTNWLSLSIRGGVLDMAVTVRSNDLIWGFSGINTIEWSMLHEMTAAWTGTKVGSVTYFIESLHVYNRHIARTERMLAMAADAAPRAAARAAFATPLAELPTVFEAWFALESRIRAGEDVGELLEQFPDPLLGDCLRMLAGYWHIHHGADATMEAFDAVRLPDHLRAAEAWLRWQNGCETLPVTAVSDDSLITAIVAMHRSKDAMYGPSWKRRGEQISILANIARKLDRLELADFSAAAGPESLIDTAVDLFTYAVKYRTFLLDAIGTLPPTGTDSWSDGTTGFERLVVDRGAAPASLDLEQLLETFAAIELSVADHVPAERRIALSEQFASDAGALVVALAQTRPLELREFLRTWSGE